MLRSPKPITCPFPKKRPCRPFRKIPRSMRKLLPNSRPKCAKRPRNSSLNGLPNYATKRESYVQKCCKIGANMRPGLVVLFLFLAATAFGQAAVGNEKFDQKQYSDAANAYEKIPAAQRDAATYNRLGISYHFSNQLKAAENAYKAALRLQPENADVLNNVAALYYSQRKFSDAERQVRRAMEKNPENGTM